MSEELSCKELVELVTDYLEGSLPVAERLRFEGHLAACPPCRGYLRQVRTTIRLLGGLKERAIPPRARDELLHAFRDWRQRYDA